MGSTSSSQRRRNQGGASPIQAPGNNAAGRPPAPAPAGAPPPGARPPSAGPNQQHPYYLRFGSPPVHFRHNPGGPMIFYVDRHAMQSQNSAPEVQETVTIKNLANLHKKSLALVPAGDKFQVTFHADCLAPTEVLIYVGAVEVPDTSNPSLAMFVPGNRDLHEWELPKGTLSVGSNQVYCSPTAQAIDVHRHRQHLQYTPPASYPLVVVLSYIATDQQQGSSSNSTSLSSAKIQKQITYADIVETEGGFGVKVVAQKLQAENGLFELEDIFGVSSDGPTDGEVVGGADGNHADDGEDNTTCVICLANDRDTTVMPCRHMCLCGECADVLRRQTNKCPICRTVIERLIRREEPSRK
eukprot:TRINITY_DN5365_c0_g1_i1.p1 TRINITY_DN5365_c0_g1~~TRINITY_DN5365_c0_g1_i1.p1  ORF type:complete len:355 (-),score=25.35 TRINITY_DN5365_c0_g1_i1:360-1424(-)